MRSSLVAAHAESAREPGTSAKTAFAQVPVVDGIPRVCGLDPFRWKGDGHDASACLPPSLAKGGATAADWIGREPRQPVRRAGAKDGARKRTRAKRERGMVLACAAGRGVLGTR